MAEQEISKITIAGFPAIETAGRADRPPLLFLHRAFVTHVPFGPWMERLAMDGWRSLATARQGRLGVGPDRARGLSIADYVEDTRQVIAAMGRKPIVIGHSLGGLIAQRIAEIGLCEGAVLLAPAPAARLPAQPVALPAYLPMMPKILLRQPVLPSRGACALIALNRVPIANRQAIHATLIPESGRAYREMIFGTFHVDPEKVRCPVLVIAGDEDRIVSPKLAKWTAERYHAEFKLYPRHAHWLIEEPGWEGIADAMTAWLAPRFPIARPAPLAGAA